MRWSITVLLSVSLLSAASAYGQWRSVLERPEHTIIYNVTFLNDVASPNVGFASAMEPWYNGRLYRTSDGGDTWQRVVFGPEQGTFNSAEMPFNFTFKNELQGWFAGGSVAREALFATTDGGITWTTTGERTSNGYVYYNRSSNRLWRLNSSLVHSRESTDEGQSWHDVLDSSRAGVCVFMGSAGISPGDFDPTEGLYPDIAPFYRTTDDGVTWLKTDFWANSSLPAASLVTHSFYVVNWTDGRFFLSRDSGATWEERTPVDTGVTPPNGWRSTGCVKLTPCGDLVYQSAHAFVISEDEGLTWRNVGGPYNTVWTMFDCTSSGIVAGGQDSSRHPGLFKLDFDKPRPPIHLTFDDSSRSKVVSAGDTFKVRLSPGEGQLLGLDSIQLQLNATGGLSLSSLEIDPSLRLIDSGYLDGTLMLVLGCSTSTPLPAILATATFRSSLSAPAAAIRLDSSKLFGLRINQNCEKVSIGPADTVKLTFTGCGSDILQHFMQSGSIFELLNVQPNPAREALHVELDKRAEGDVQVEVRDILGTERFTSIMSGTSQDLDVSDLPNGTYFLRLSSGGEVRTRRFTITR